MADGLRALRPTPALLDRRTTTDHVADALRTAIVTGAFQDGEVISQVALAERFGVSRVPVREAIRQLQAEGLITAQPHHRVAITGLTVDGIVEIFEIRALLESYLLEKSFPHIDSAQIAKIARLFEELEHSTDHRRWLQKNREFHRALYEPANAPVALSLVEQLAARNERYLHQRGRGVHRQKEAQDEHRAILAAVRAKDLRRARAELDRHVSRTREIVSELFASASDGR